jgi:hypothetical protein
LLLPLPLPPLPLPPPLVLCCRQPASATVVYDLVVVIVAVSVTVAATAFSWLVIVVCAPTIADTAGVFVTKVAARGGSTASAALLLPLTLQCLPNFHHSRQAGRQRCPAAATLGMPLPCRRCRCAANTTTRLLAAASLPLMRCRRTATTTNALPMPPLRCLLPP